MREVNFEGLGLSLKFNNILCSFNGLSIHWYAVMIVLGIVAGFVVCKINENKYKIKYEYILELSLITFPMAIIFARLYYVLFNLDYYMQNPADIIKIWNGGIAIYGAIIGSIIAIVIYCKIRKINILEMFDYIVPALAIGQCIGRWGNFFNTEAHGTETNSLLRMGIYENGKYIQVHPTFLYESICTLLIFIVLMIMTRKKKYNGQLTCIYFFMYGIARAIIESFRTDSLMIGEFRISQIISIIIAVICGIILLKNRKGR